MATGVQGPLLHYHADFVPSLKGLTFPIPAYPALSAWAINFRPAERDSVYAPFKRRILPTQVVLHARQSATLPKAIVRSGAASKRTFSAHKVVGASSSPKLLASRRPPVVCAATAKQSPDKRPHPAYRNCLDLERNSADAIASAMTSSVVTIPTATQWEPWSNWPPTTLAGGTALRSLANLSTLTMNLEENPSNLAQLPAFAVTSARFGFRGRTPSGRPFGGPGITTWKRTVLPVSCGCQEINATYCILLRFLPNLKSNGTPLLCSGL